MPAFIGYSSQNSCLPKNTNQQLDNLDDPYSIPSGQGRQIWGNKFTLYDAKLVLQDFVNALNIPIGSKVGQPGYGTTLWTFLFEPNTVDVQTACETEIRRVAALDPRLQLNTVKSFPQELGVLIEVQCAIVPFNQVQTVSIFASRQTGKAVLT